ncbi:MULTISPECIES: hypothetical protein [Silvimonas]|uniref:bestrophin-like domain n=1 Tax=Silvimonas TaxID=300264 RepID=UPI0024B361F3|nr:MULTISPECIES: hypothetical protein [Silvimonas]MDR3427508.1 hypothetical protein [Silvimonas sp.]
MELLANHPVLFCLVSLLLMSLAAWVGAVVLRQKKPMDEATVEDFSVVQSATLTLLALVIGFSLSMAVGRYDQRKNYEEEEANAIGTEFIRVDFLSVPAAAQLRTLLVKYLDQRVLFYRTNDAQQLGVINTTTAQIQADMWALVRTGASAAPNPITALVTAGMNDVINTQGYTQAAIWNRIPHSAWALMIVIGLFSNALVGYGSRSKQVRSRFLVIMPLVVSLSFMLIADIDSPRSGIIRVVPQNLISLAQSLPKP